MAWNRYGQWVDEDELQGMLYSGVRPTLPFYSQPSFTSPLSTLNQEAAGNFNMWGSPASNFQRTAMSDELGSWPAESVEPALPSSSYGVSQNYGDFSPMMGTLADMVANQPPALDTNIVTDDPTRPVTINDRVFHENMPVIGSN